MSDGTEETKDSDTIERMVSMTERLIAPAEHERETRSKELGIMEDLTRIVQIQADALKSHTALIKNLRERVAVLEGNPS